MGTLRYANDWALARTCSALAHNKVCMYVLIMLYWAALSRTGPAHESEAEG